MSVNATDMEVVVTPQFTVPTVQDALARVNRWLHREIGTAVHAATATFDPATFYWHVAIELAYGATGPLGVVGDVYLHATTGDFAGSPSAEEFRQRAEALAAAHGIE
ncbi:MAG: hypothetical protein JMDDDDMK_03944 [Acidobacteria bacterium]|nr:hypothetical protein [Acidobacteriota bacterium]